MQRQDVKSSNIESVGHEGDTIEIKFKSGDVWQYFGVKKEKFDRMMASESIGKFFASEIKNKHSSRFMRDLSPVRKNKDGAEIGDSVYREDSKNNQGSK